MERDREVNCLWGNIKPRLVQFDSRYYCSCTHLIAEIKCSECKPQHRSLSQIACLVFGGKKMTQKAECIMRIIYSQLPYSIFCIIKKGTCTFFLLMTKTNKVLTLFHRFICRFRMFSNIDCLKGFLLEFLNMYYIYYFSTA